MASMNIFGNDKFTDEPELKLNEQILDKISTLPSNLSKEQALFKEEFCFLLKFLTKRETERAKSDEKTIGDIFEHEIPISCFETASG